MEIRFAQPEDVGGILSLLRQVGGIHHQGRPDIFRSNAQKYGASQVLSMVDSTSNPIFVAVEDGQVLGYGFCQLKEFSNDPVMQDYTSLYIDDLCVDEAHRGRKIGTQIYSAICRYAKQRHCYSITLNVWSCNASAQRFYESLGLKPQKVCLESILEDA